MDAKSRYCLTHGGVTSVGQPAGAVVVKLNDPGDTIMDMVVLDNAGKTVEVHMDRAQATELIIALASMIADM